MNILTIFLSSIVLIGIDSIYLYSTKSFTQRQISMIQGSSVSMNIYGILLCYICLIVGINYFIIDQNKSVMDAFILGIVIYGVYEGTNWAIFKMWSPLLVVMDTIWGGILFALTAYIIKKIK